MFVSSDKIPPRDGTRSRALNTAVRLEALTGGSGASNGTRSRAFLAAIVSGVEYLGGGNGFSVAAAAGSFRLFRELKLENVE